MPTGILTPTGRIVTLWEISATTTAVPVLSGVPNPNPSDVELDLETTLRRWGTNVPAGGGAYFRLFPYAVVRAALRDCAHRGAPGTFYIHPWELDPDQPRIAVPWPTRVRHYGGLRRTAPRLERLLVEFRFTAIADTLARLTDMARV